MLKKILILSFLCLQNLNSIDQVLVVAAGAKVTNSLVESSNFIKRAVAPKDGDKGLQDLAKLRLQLLKAEDALVKCLVKNARGQRAASELPLACEQERFDFESTVGYPELIKIRQEFLLAANELAKREVKRGWSGKKKLLVGTAALTAVGVGGVLVAPILLPGGVIATKLAAIVGSAKAATVAVGTSVASAGAGAKIVATGTVVQLFGSDLNGKLNAAASIATLGAQVRPLVYQTAEEEYLKLLAAKNARPSLYELILNKRG